MFNKMINIMSVLSGRKSKGKQVNPEKEKKQPIKNNRKRKVLKDDSKTTKWPMNTLVRKKNIGIIGRLIRDETDDGKIEVENLETSATRPLETRDNYELYAIPDSTKNLVGKATMRGTYSRAPRVAV